MILCNPTTPAGTLVDREFLDLLATKCEQRRIWLVVDEAFIDFTGEDARAWAPRAVTEHKRLLVLRSQTKFYCIAGLRLGYALAHADTLADFAPLGQPWSVNTLAQAAGVHCLDQQEYESNTRRMVERWRVEQRAMLHELGLETLPSAAKLHPVPPALGRAHRGPGDRGLRPAGGAAARRLVIRGLQRAPSAHRGCAPARINSACARP